MYLRIILATAFNLNFFAMKTMLNRYLSINNLRKKFILSINNILNNENYLRFRERRIAAIFEKSLHHVNSSGGNYNLCCYLWTVLQSLKVHKRGCKVTIANIPNTEF